MAKHHIIFVPGIGDHRPLLQDKGIGWWRFLGVVPHYHPVGWLGHEPFATKLRKLLAEIDNYLAAGDSVSLMGFSAGASVVLNAFAARRGQLSAVICVSGKINRPQAVSSQLLNYNSAFLESLELLARNLPSFTTEDKRHMLTLNPWIDAIVPLKDAVIPGVKRWRTIAFSHPLSIAFALTIYAPWIAGYMKYLQKYKKTV